MNNSNFEKDESFTLFEKSYESQFARWKPKANQKIEAQISELNIDHIKLNAKE